MTVSQQVFSSEQLDRIIAESLPKDAQPGEKIIVGSVDVTGAQVVAAFKYKAPNSSLDWTIMAAAQHTWDGDNKFGTKVLLRW